MSAIGIVGSGAVGQAVVCALVATGLGEELVICSRTGEQAVALATDAEDQRVALGSPTRVCPGSPADLRGCDTVVIALRANFPSGDSSNMRMGGLRANAPLIVQWGETLTGYPGVVLVVTNPVDLMSRLVAEVSGSSRVYGIGSNLDSARYRAIVAGHFREPLVAVRGHVIGEHGENAVVCASSTTVLDSPAMVPIEEIQAKLYHRPRLIMRGVGRVRGGAAGAVVATLRKTLGVEDGIEELSTSYQGGWLGVPLRWVSGRPELAMPVLNPDEARQFAAADIKLRTTYSSLHSGGSVSSTIKKEENAR